MLKMGNFKHPNLKLGFIKNNEKHDIEPKTRKWFSFYLPRGEMKWVLRRGFWEEEQEGSGQGSQRNN